MSILEIVSDVMWGTGCAVWLAVLGWVVWVFAEPCSSTYLAYGCDRCDWGLIDPTRCRWWTVKPRYRWHCVTVHHDWPPQYTRRSAAGLETP